MKQLVIAAIFASTAMTAPAYAAMSKDQAVAECRAIHGSALKRGAPDANAQFSACVKAKMKGK
jgi:hypothetical protein